MSELTILCATEGDTLTPLLSGEEIGRLRLRLEELRNQAEARRKDDLLEEAVAFEDALRQIEEEIAASEELAKSGSARPVVVKIKEPTFDDLVTLRGGKEAFRILEPRLADGGEVPYRLISAVEAACVRLLAPNLSEDRRFFWTRLRER